MGALSDMAIKKGEKEKWEQSSGSKVVNFHS